MKKEKKLWTFYGRQMVQIEFIGRMDGTEEGVGGTGGRRNTWGRRAGCGRAALASMFPALHYANIIKTRGSQKRIGGMEVIFKCG